METIVSEKVPNSLAQSPKVKTVRFQLALVLRALGILLIPAASILYLQISV